MPSPHPLRLTVLIRMTKRKMATIDSHTPLWVALAHFNSVLMHHVSIKTLIMWQRRPQGQIASNRLDVMLNAWARWRRPIMCVVSQMFAFRVNFKFAQRDLTSVPNQSAVSVPARKPVLFWCLFGLKPEWLCISYLSEESLNRGPRGQRSRGERRTGGLVSVALGLQTDERYIDEMN